MLHICLLDLREQQDISGGVVDADQPVFSLDFEEVCIPGVLLPGVVREWAGGA